MPKIFRKNDLRFEKRESPLPEFAWHTTPKLAKSAAAQKIDFDVRSLDPGLFSFPYHFHRAAEELFFILSGEATLRSPDGFHKLGAGDLVFFEEGPTSAHQLFSSRRDPPRPISSTTMEICPAPIWISGRLPASIFANTPIRARSIFCRGSKFSRPPRKWAIIREKIARPIIGPKKY
jgi:uncharacterized cupin superfamily protein